MVTAVVCTASVVAGAPVVVTAAVVGTVVFVEVCAVVVSVLLTISTVDEATVDVLDSVVDAAVV